MGLIYNNTRTKILLPNYSIGAGVHFKASDNTYIATPIINFGTSDLSFSFWLRANAQVGTIFAVGNYSDNYGGGIAILIRNDLYGLSNAIQFTLFSNADIAQRIFLTSTNVFNDGVLFHLLFTWESSTNTQKIYINNVEVGYTYIVAPSTSLVGSLTPSNQTGRKLTFGLYDDARVGLFHYTGDMYRPVIWSKVLSTSERNLNYFYKGARNVNISQTIAEWNGQYKSGTSYADNIGGYNGTLNNFVTTTPGMGNAWINSNGSSILT
jgi:Concanavalin A-like lectin/glucanases superfamily